MYNYHPDLINQAKVSPVQIGMPDYLVHPVTPYPVLYPNLKHQLVTKDNYDQVMGRILRLCAQHKPLVGLDIESEDGDRHAGLNEFMRLDPKSLKYKNPKKLVFDVQRTNITGFSLYLDQDHTCYYFNTGHADVENRIALDQVIPALEYIKQHCTYIIHNACFEIGMLNATWGFDVGKNYICTLTMAVSGYNDDEYPLLRYKANGLGGIKQLMPKLKKAFLAYRDGQEMTGEQQDLVHSILGKQSVSSWSYNGLVRESRYGYGLKEAVKSWFGHKMDTFKDTLNGKAHMGLLTSQEACVYGADDAYWCVRLFYAIYDFMMATNPQVFNTFLQQENPMPRIFAKSWIRGMPVNKRNIDKREASERANYAEALRDLQKAIRAVLPFDEEPKWRMVFRQDKWYLGKNNDAYLKYRNRVKAFAEQNFETDEDIILAVSGPITDKLCRDLQRPLKKNAANFAHYMMQRTLLHDLCNLPFIFIKGDLKTDKEARGKLKERVAELKESTELSVQELVRYIEKTQGRKPTESELQGIHTLALANQNWFLNKGDAVIALLEALNTIATVETRIKLFINPYLMLTDPDTNRMYPMIRSELNTRRMSCENPNAMQLAKRGESTYIRGFWLPQNEDHVILSLDWSQVELVLVGSASDDPAFAEAYGQIPYKDLHAKAASAAIAVKLPGFSEDDFNQLHDPEAAKTNFIACWGEAGNYPFYNPATGVPLTKPFKDFRNLGKPVNFGYWFSGGCFTAAEGFGWSAEETFEAADNYRNTFPMAEKWRVATQEFAKNFGYVMLPDGHRRTRFESTMAWFVWWVGEWAKYGLRELGIFLGKKIQRRAGNQVVNARIQGSGATLAKRSAITMDSEMIEEGGQFDAYFLMPIHDELVFSVHKDQAVAFGNYLKQVMCNHPEIVPKLKLDGTCSIGLTLEPYDSEKAPFGQIELDEAPFIEGYTPKELEYQPLPDAFRQRVVDYLFEASKETADAN